jgi:t-SNARE complex subunit (syntaxin)
MRNAVVAKNVLHEELGYIGERREPYNLDQDTRDILLTHARQDAAHALANSYSALRELRSMRQIIVRFTVGVAAVAVIVIVILAVDVLVGR